MILIEPNAREQMIADAERAFPDECCGFFFGSEDDRRTVTQIRVVDNAKEGDKRRRFEIAPRDYLRAEAFAEEQGLQLLGVYHSHPNHPAVPSEQDRLAAQPYFSYIILSVLEGRFAGLRSWQLHDDFQFKEENIIDQNINTNQWQQ